MATLATPVLEREKDVDFNSCCFRYSLTNGVLSISRPTGTQDSGRYFCEATNPVGTVLSQSGVLSFGSKDAVVWGPVL